MAIPLDTAFEQQLVERRRRLQAALTSAGPGGPPALQALLGEIDGALDRLADGTFGYCEVCHDAIEPERLVNDPLVRVCLDHLSPGERAALERDLDLAARIQTGLLPQPEVRQGVWHAARRYRPAGLVSGDYCDLVPAANGCVYFMLGDVSGKGVSASMLMVHLHAMFRTLIPLGLPLPAMIERASCLFCESTLANHYATLACMRASDRGAVEVVNAGHPPLLLLRPDGVARLDATGLPLGLFCTTPFAVQQYQLEPGDTLIAYSDGLTEARDAGGREFGIDRLAEAARRHRNEAPGALIDHCLDELAAFQGTTPPHDDLTIMAVRRAG